MARHDAVLLFVVTCSHWSNFDVAVFNYGLFVAVQMQGLLNTMAAVSQVLCSLTVVVLSPAEPEAWLSVCRTCRLGMHVHVHGWTDVRMLLSGQ